MKKTILLALFLFFSFETFSKQKISLSQFLTASDSLNKKREKLVHAACITGFGSSLIALNYAWYVNYPRSSFHFFDDNGEWLQMDKAGHAYSAYNEAYWTSNLYQWAGVPQRRAIEYGAVAGFGFQLTIEIMDGFSKEWGFSLGDLTANTVGSGILLGQELLWREQRFHLKFSTSKRFFDEPRLEQRANEYFGKSIQERFLKDYNAQSYWLSFNISSFMKKENNFPKWLNIAFGYGVDNLFGGYTNQWGYDIQGKPTEDYSSAFLKINKTDLPRYRQFFLSPDIDFSRIKTKSKFLKTLFLALNVVKIPAPTLEYNTLYQMKFHFLYF